MTGVSCLRSGEDIEVVAKGLRRISFGAEINQAASAIFSHIVDKGEGVLVGAPKGWMPRSLTLLTTASFTKQEATLRRICEAL